MSVKIAIATDFNGSHGDPEVPLRQIAAAGFTHLHWCHQWNTDHLYSDWEIAKIAKILRETGLTLLDIHGSDGSAGGLISSWYAPDEAFRRAGVELVMNRLRMFAMLRGEGTLMMHIPSYRVNMDEAARAVISKRLDALRRSLDELVPVSQALGIPLALENMAGDTWEEFDLLFREYPADAVGLCYDSGHANISVDGHVADGIEHFERHLDRLQALHLHDNDHSGDQHQPPFYGNVDWERIAADIAKSAYPRVISFELSISNTPYAEDPVAFLKDAYARTSRVEAMLREFRAMPLH